MGHTELGISCCWGGGGGANIFSLHGHGGGYFI